MSYQIALMIIIAASAVYSRIEYETTDTDNVTEIRIFPRAQLLHFLTYPHNVMVTEPMKNKTNWWIAFCGGSIISPDKVLSAADCFYDRSMNLIRPLNVLKVIGATPFTPIEPDTSFYEAHAKTLWFNVTDLFIQDHFNFPMFNLAILKLNKHAYYSPNTIAQIATLDLDFDGVCHVPIAQPNSSWGHVREVYMADAWLMTEYNCRSTFLWNLREFYCSQLDFPSAYGYVLKGGGVICNGTDDPNEIDKNFGVLVGVTTTSFSDTAVLHTRVAIYKDWIRYINETK